jgi:regulator of RNase E activity RraB
VKSAPTPHIVNEALEKAIRLVGQAHKLGYSVADMTELFKDEVDTITLDSAVKVLFTS